MEIASITLADVINMAISKNAIIVILVAVVVVVAGASAAIVLTNNSKDPKSPSLLPGAELKVLGNAEGDGDLDKSDVSELEKIIKAGGTVEEYPLADANNDKVIDDNDVDFVKAIINWEEGDPQVPVWHVNFHDDGNGVMAMEMVQTMYPIKSAIATGSSNGLMMLQLMDIVDEIKGACYSSSSADATLFSTTYLDTSKCVFLGKKTGEITYEDGKAGSSNVIKEQNVTALITDWNKTYIENEADFEAGNVDVVRIAAAAVTPEYYTHTINLLGFLFQKEDRAEDLLDMYEECYKMIDKYKSDGSLSAVASSMAAFNAKNKYAYISAGGSDYTEIITSAGLKFGLENYNFGTTTSLKTDDYLEVYDTNKYDWDYIVHIRANLNYKGSVSTATLKEYTDAFGQYWKYTNGEHQYLVSGVIPVPLRVLYVESIFNDDLSASQVDELHAKFVKDFYINSELDISGMQFFIDGTTLYAA